jgi:hypothetical protein
MAIVRLGQFHCENQNITELVSDTSGTNITTTVPTFDTAQFRTGLRSVRIDGFRRPHGLLFPSTSEFWAGVWFMHRGVSDISNDVSILRFSGTPMRFIHYSYPDNILSMGVNGNVIEVEAYRSGFMRQIVWMHLGLYFKADPVDGICSFYIDGKNVLEFEGDTSGDVSACYMGGTPFANNAWTENWFDDFYVDSIVGETISPPPAKRFLFSLPNAAGINTEWAPTGAAINYQAVDEAPPDNDTSYVEAATVGVIDSYNVASFTLPTHWENIPAALPYVWAKELNGGAAIDLHLYDGVYSVGSTKSLDTPYASYFDRMTAQPGGGDWDQASVNAIQVGMDRVS